MVGAKITRGSANELFEEVTTLVMSYGEETDSRIGKTIHLTNLTLALTNPEDNIVDLPYRKTSRKYIEAELKWYESADPSADFIKHYAKTWGRIADENGNVNSNYGYLMKEKYGFNQFDYCYDKLSKSKHDRQAIIHFKWADENFGLDTPCTSTLQFTVFKNKLHAHIYMRSNDAFWGFCNDIVFFTKLQVDMHRKLKEIYPELELGTYFHTVGDFHIYEKDWKKIPFAMTNPNLK